MGVSKLPKSLTLAFCSVLLVPASQQVKEGETTKREGYIGFKVTENEGGLIRLKARNSRMSVSEYVRRSALNKKIIRIDGLGELLPELRRIGNNLNQVTVIMRTRNVQNVDFHEMKCDFRTLHTAVTDALRKGEADGDYQNGERKVG